VRALARFTREGRLERLNFNSPLSTLALQKTHTQKGDVNKITE